MPAGLSTGASFVCADSRGMWPIRAQKCRSPNSGCELAEQRFMQELSIAELVGESG